MKIGSYYLLCLVVLCVLCVLVLVVFGWTCVLNKQIFCKYENHKKITSWNILLLLKETPYITRYQVENCNSSTFSTLVLRTRILAQVINKVIYKPELTFPSVLEVGDHS